MRVASRVVERLKTYDLRKLESIIRVSKLHRTIVQSPASPQNSNLANTSKKVQKYSN